MKKFQAAVLCIMIITPAVVFPKTLWRDRNIYSSSGSLKRGDVLVVSIDDISAMRFTFDLSSDSNASITSNPDATITGFLPKVSANKSMNSGDSTDFAGRGQMNITLAATIVRRLQNGRYEIAGNRYYSFNGVTNSIRVSGSVDPALIEGRNVNSQNIADFRLTVRGAKDVFNITRPELKENESASNALTEQEKQRLIIDYLEKILGELSN